MMRASASVKLRASTRYGSVTFLFMPFPSFSRSEFCIQTRYVSFCIVLISVTIRIFCFVSKSNYYNLEIQYYLVIFRMDLIHI